MALVRGFFPGSPPLIDAATHHTMLRALDVRVDVRLAGATHYTMLHAPYARTVARAIDLFVGLGLQD